jgi:hypothetical protein
MEQAQPQEQTQEPQAPVKLSKYSRGDKVRHRKTGVEYFIQITPDEFVRLEATGELAYGYAAAGTAVSVDSPIWFRSQAEIEDTERYDHIPAPADPRLDPEFVEREKAQEKEFFAAFQTEVTRLVTEADLKADFDRPALLETLKAGLVKFATDTYGDKFEILIDNVWMVEHAGKGGVPVYIADHTNGFQHELSTLFDFPAEGKPAPKFSEDAPITTHKVEGIDTSIQVRRMVPTDFPDSYDFYLINGFATEGVGGIRPQTGNLIQFQSGPVDQIGHTGVTFESLLAVQIHRLEHFNQGEMHCEENDVALAGMYQAMEALKSRALRRQQAGLLGVKQEE